LNTMTLCRARFSCEGEANVVHICFNPAHWAKNRKTAPGHGGIKPVVKTRIERAIDENRK
jgi:hypothetical protein